MMTHYFVPVPKGLRYTYNGQELRMPDNGLFDLLTGEFKQGFRASTYSNRTDIIPSLYTGTLEDGKEFIFLRDQEISETNFYDSFNNWDYDTSNVSLVKQVTTPTRSYT